MDGGREETWERRGRGDQMDGRMEVRGERELSPTVGLFTISLFYSVL